MKLLNQVNDKLAKAGTPYSPQEINEHEYSARIWATIAQCKREAQQACEDAWDKGYWEGVHGGHTK